MTHFQLPRELAEHNLIPFVSSERPLLTLFMDLYAPARGGPWPALLLFHGWHQNCMDLRERARTLATFGFCVLNLNLRGRAGTIGSPDANGFELRDCVDALNYARRTFPQLCSSTLPPRAFGASGGGGNVYALVGKCPDLLSAAAVFCGVSDYAAWYEWNERGNYRDEMETWIANNPRTHQEAYRSRSGIAVACNRLCPLMIRHGTADDCVPVTHARTYLQAAEHSATEEVPPLDYLELDNVGHQVPDEPYLADAANFLLQHHKPYYISQRGRWIVAGFLKTQYFEVLWDQIDLVGTIDIDLRRRRLFLECPGTQAAQLRIAGPMREKELQHPTFDGTRILSQREENGWTILDVQLQGKPLGLRWSN